MSSFAKSTEIAIGTPLLVIGFLLALIWLCLIWPLMQALGALGVCSRCSWVSRLMER